MQDNMNGFAFAERPTETPEWAAPYAGDIPSNPKQWCKCHARILVMARRSDGRDQYQERCPCCWSRDPDAPFNVGVDRAVKAFGRTRVDYAVDADEFQKMTAQERISYARKAIFWIRYREHLASEAWAQTRRRVLHSAGGLCQRCGAHAQHVHHKTYETLGAERDEDLEALCAPCHHAEHGRIF